MGHHPKLRINARFCRSRISDPGLDTNVTSEEDQLFSWAGLSDVPVCLGWGNLAAISAKNPHHRCSCLNLGSATPQDDGRLPKHFSGGKQQYLDVGVHGLRPGIAKIVASLMGLCVKLLSCSIFKSPLQSQPLSLCNSLLCSPVLATRYSGFVDAVVQRWALVVDEYLQCPRDCKLPS